MAIKNLIARGIGFDDTGDSTTKFIPTLGLTPAAAGTDIEVIPLWQLINGFTIQTYGLRV